MRQVVALIFSVVFLCACEPAQEATATARQSVPAPTKPTPSPSVPADTLDQIILKAIALGKRVNLPTCEDATPDQACIETDRTETSPTRVYLPALADSDHYHEEVAVLEIDGLAEGVWIQTRSTPGADEHMRDDLVRSFGDPSSIGRDESDTSEWARWRPGGLHVFWFGRTEDRPYGAAIIETAKGELFSAEEQARREVETPKP